MGSKYNENGVITGVMDSFCLSCETHLKIKDIQDHILDPSHLKTFEATSYVEKYKGELIKKMNIGYYCEVCNEVIQTLAKIGIHVKDITHINKRNERLLKGCDGGVIVFDEILIDVDSWHGLSEGSCLICDVDYTDGNEHKNDAKHILKLVQSKFEIKENIFIYRKINENSYNCLICNTIITKVSKDTHSDTSHHIDNYMKCQQNKTTFDTYNKKEGTIDKKNPILPKGGEKNDKTDDDKKCFEETKASSEASKTQTLLVNDTPDKASDDEDDDDKIISPAMAFSKAMAFAKENKLKYKRNSTYCKFCNVTISSSLKRLKEHVAEASHQAKFQNHPTKKLNKVPMPTFIDYVITVQNFFHHDIIINSDICISMLSFCMITINNDRRRCQACNVNIQPNEIERHKHTLKHLNAMTVTPVLVDFKTEFVREIRPHVYHCGFCNFVEASLDQMKNHLKSVNHFERKAHARIRMQRYLEEVEEDRQKEIFLHNFMRMFN